MNARLRQGGWLRRFARRIAAAVAECHDAQRHLYVRYAAADTHLPDPDRPPDTYQEFLFRTSGPLHREPTAEQRTHGQPVH